jgi:hypothetical protein
MPEPLTMMCNQVSQRRQQASQGPQNANHPLLLLAARLLLQPNAGRCCPSMQRHQKQELKHMSRPKVNTVTVKKAVTRMMTNKSQLQLLGHYPGDYCYPRCWRQDKMTTVKRKTWRRSHHNRKTSRNRQPNFGLC